METEEIRLQLKDDQWPFEFIDHHRHTARAIVFDDRRYFYFVHVERDDDFGKASYIETAGGGVEDGEDFHHAVLRELKEELGVETDIIGSIGTVEDNYNIIHRHNINHYFLCKIKRFSDRHLTEDEIKKYHLQTVKFSGDEALKRYTEAKKTKIGSLVANREVPILQRAIEMLETI